MISFPLGASIKLFFVGYYAAEHITRYNTAVARPKRKPLCRLESGISPCVCGPLRSFVFNCRSIVMSPF